MIYHVALTGCDQAPGTQAAPFRTISKAASLAQPGDTVRVHAGTYREWVNPKNGGTADHRIVYESAGDGEVIISGGEAVSNWTPEGDGVWRTEIPNAAFTVRNPYATELAGDWLFEEYKGFNLGEVYLNKVSLYEYRDMDGVKNPKIYETAMNPQESLLTWHSEVNDYSTVIWANFGDADPRVENVEINARPYCFWPSETGKGYITVRGFTLEMAGPQWAPPTALQEGLIGPHWSKGWIIENNIIRNSKCTGISIGKDASSGDSDWPYNEYKNGTQREQEVIFRALWNGWSKDTIGSHIIRNNTIYDCEQAGIVGHLGGAFCEIYKNTIYRIHHKQLYHGAEVAGIKLHGSLDTQICDNKIYSSYRGVWLDWQAQGTRIAHNLFYDNRSEDFFVEVCHGPYMVDHNIFLSPMNFRNLSQGAAFAHNLITGHFVVRPDRMRQTPYHIPHATAVAGYATFIGGDDRYYNNIFLRNDNMDNEPQPMEFFQHLPLPPKEEGIDEARVIDGMPARTNSLLHPVGLGAYNGYPKAGDKFWVFRFGPGMNERHMSFYAGGNLYLKNAVPCELETDAKVYADEGIQVSVDMEKQEVTVKILNPALLKGASPDIITTALLGNAYQADMPYEEPDGTPYRFDRDYFGKARPEANVTPGPFELCGDEPVEFVLG